jgi:hypothetical protein
MKKMFALLALTVVGSTQAQELSFGDVNYFLKKNQFQLSADATQEHNRFKTGGTDYRLRGDVFSTRLNYALADNLNIFAGLSYNYDMEFASESGGSKSASAYQDGLRNPSLGLNYRLVQQSENGGINVDLGLGYDFSLQDERMAGIAANGSKKNGNAANGRNASEINLRVGRKWNEANEWQLAAGTVYNYEGDRERLVAGGASSKTDLDASWDQFIRATYQYRPVKEMMFQVSWQTTRVGDFDEKNSTTTFKRDSVIDHDFIFRAKYLITENFIARFNYTARRLSDVDYDINGVKNDLTSRRGSTFGLGVDFLF